MPEPAPAVTARHVAADLLGFIARAIAIAVVCAIGLAAATLLLALPARADAREVKPWPWADTWPVAKLSAPTLGIERHVLVGADGGRQRCVVFAFEQPDRGGERGTRG